MLGYKDIINFSIIRELREKMSDACIILNNLMGKSNIENRESEYYEVYTKQYKHDMKNLQELRDACMKVADECNAIMFKMNTYHIKQYYLDPEELSEYELDEYKAQLPIECPTESPIIEENKNDEDDIW